MGKRIERGRVRFMLDCPHCGKRTSVSVPTIKNLTLTPEADAVKWLMNGQIKYKHKACGRMLRIKVWTMHAAYVENEAPSA